MKPMGMNEVVIGTEVRHMASGELFTVASVPFWFNGEPAVTLRDKKGHARISLLSGLSATNQKTEEQNK
jgi:hypothetical protein